MGCTLYYIVSYTSHGASLMAQLVNNLPATRETWVGSLGWEDSPGEGKGYPLQYSGLDTTERLSLPHFTWCFQGSPGWSYVSVVLFCLYVVVCCYQVVTLIITGTYTYKVYPPLLMETNIIVNIGIK